MAHREWRMGNWATGVSHYSLLSLFATHPIANQNAGHGGRRWQFGKVD
jgi:hypothetical protein